MNHHLQDIATIYWNLSQNGNGSYGPRHASGEMYIPYVVGSANVGSVKVSLFASYFGPTSNYVNYPGFFVGYAYAYGEFNQKANSPRFNFIRYSYLGNDGWADDRSEYISDIPNYHSNRITFIGSLQ